MLKRLAFFLMATSTVVLLEVFDGKNLIAGLIAILIGLMLIAMAVRYLVFGLILHSYLTEMTISAKWRVATIFSMFYIFLPVVIVDLATSGNRRGVLAMIVNGPGNGGAMGVPEGFSLLSIPILLVVLPEYLNLKGRDEVADSMVPGWLAGFSSAFTAVFIFTTRFGGAGQIELQKVPLGLWSVAAFGVAVLIAPFYKSVAKHCIKQGVAVVFDPLVWWRSFTESCMEIARAAKRAAEDSECAQNTSDSNSGSCGSAEHDSNTRPTA